MYANTSDLAQSLINDRGCKLFYPIEDINIDRLYEPIQTTNLMAAAYSVIIGSAPKSQKALHNGHWYFKCFQYFDLKWCQQHLLAAATENLDPLSTDYRKLLLLYGLYDEIEFVTKATVIRRLEFSTDWGEFPYLVVSETIRLDGRPLGPRKYKCNDSVIAYIDYHAINNDPSVFMDPQMFKSVRNNFQQTYAWGARVSDNLNSKRMRDLVVKLVNVIQTSNATRTTMPASVGKHTYDNKVQSRAEKDEEVNALTVWGLICLFYLIISTFTPQNRYISFFRIYLAIHAFVNIYRGFVYFDYIEDIISNDKLEIAIGVAGMMYLFIWSAKTKRNILFPCTLLVIYLAFTGGAVCLGFDVVHMLVKFFYVMARCWLFITVGISEFLATRNFKKLIYVNINIWVCIAFLFFPDVAHPYTIIMLVNSFVFLPNFIYYLRTSKYDMYYPKPHIISFWIMSVAMSFSLIHRLF